MKNDYIKAVLELLAAGKDTQAVLQGLQKTLTQKGHMRLYAAVLRGVVRDLESGNAHKSIVYVASEADIQSEAVQITEALQTLGVTDEPQTLIDSTIIGGVVVKNGTTVLDHSYKTALTNLYRAITK